MSARVISTSEGTRRGAFEAFDWLLLALAGGIWGSSFLFIAEALDAFPPMLITWLRVTFGFVTLSLIPGSRAPIERHDRPRVRAVGVLWMAIPLSMFPFAEQRVSSAVAGMMNGATPIAVAAVATVLLRRWPRPRQQLGLAIGTVGIVLAALPSLSNGSNSAAGVGMILLAICFYGVALNAVVPLQQRYGALPVLRRALGVACLLLAPFGIASIPAAHWSTKAFAANLALGVLGSAAAYVAASTLAGRVGSTRASAITYIVPVVSLFLGAVVRDEHIAALTVAGSAVILAGAFVASRAEH